MSSRRRRGTFSAAVLLSAAATSAVAVPSPVRADAVQWDGNGATLPNPAGGSGTWDTTTSNWWNGTSEQSYGSGVTPHDAIFGVAGGAVTAAVPVTARSLTFNTGGYSLSGGTITLADVGTVTVTNASDTATIGQTVDSTGVLTKLGAGTLTLSTSLNNTFTGITYPGRRR